MFRRLRVEFASLEEFQREYQRNVANGGIFASTDETFEMREVIEVELALTFCDKVVPLQCEVVGRVSPSAGGVSQRAGIAVQFLEPIDELRTLFSEWIGIAPSARPEPGRAPWLERPGPTRRHERATVFASVAIMSTAGIQTGETRNLSRSGSLISLHQNPPPRVGEAISVELRHPSTDAVKRIPGRVVRSSMHLRDRPSLAVAFEVPTPQEEEIAKFIGEICHMHGSTSADAITGPIHILGLPSLVQMFSSSAEGGTLTVFSAEKSGRIVFASGGLQHARVGAVIGVKALSRILGWTQGRFEFMPVLPPDTHDDEPMPMYGAVLEAVQFVDELQRLDIRALPDMARLKRTSEPVPEDLPKLTREVLALCDVVGSVSEIIDLGPGFDAQIYAALLELLAGGLLEVHAPAGEIM